jgi:RNA-directed DNA polymerase
VRIQEYLFFMTKQTQSSRAEMPEPTQEHTGRNPGSPSVGASSVMTRKENDCRECELLMEAVVERENMRAAFRRVVSNKGVAGADGMSVNELKPYLTEHWERIKDQLLGDRFKPQLVKGVEIPKPDGGVRKLGIPTVVDRVIEQAVAQVLEPQFTPGFSEHSYGFIRGRSAHQAVLQAQQYVAQGFDWVVDIDLEKFLEPSSYCTPVHER